MESVSTSPPRSRVTPVRASKPGKASAALPGAADAAGETSGSASPPERPAACCTVTGSSREKSSDNTLISIQCFILYTPLLTINQKEYKIPFILPRSRRRTSGAHGKLYEDRGFPMQKNAWTYTMAGTVFAAVAVMLHWLQVQKIFDPETGLPTLHAPITTLLVVVLVLVAAALWWLSGRMKTDCAPEEPEDALALPHRETGWILIAAAALAALRLGVPLLQGGQHAYEGRGAAWHPVRARTRHDAADPPLGGFGAALSVLPVLFFCLWLVVFYKENAANPILWSYGMEILAIAMCLLAVFRLSAYLFYRAKPRRAIFACMLALITSLATLTDSVSLGARAVLGGWGIGTAVMCWIIINNLFRPRRRKIPIKKAFV